MLIYTNVIDSQFTFLACLSRARESYPHLDTCFLDRLRPHGSRTHTHKYDVKMHGWKRPWRNRRRNFAHKLGDTDEMYAPTWDEWGVFLREVFAVDPDARCGVYNGVEHFHDLTNDRFRPHIWNVDHPIDCTGCDLRMLNT